MSLHEATVVIESLRWNAHYLEAGTADKGKATPGKGNVYVTDGNPAKKKFLWKIIEKGGGVVNLESILWKGHFLEAGYGDFGDGGPGKGNVYVTDGNPDKKEFLWKVVKRGGGVVNFESVKWKGHFLESGTAQVGKGNVYVTKSDTKDPHGTWANWKINVIKKPSPPVRVTKVECVLEQLYALAKGTGFRQEETLTYKVGTKESNYSEEKLIHFSAQAMAKCNWGPGGAGGSASVNAETQSAFVSASQSTSMEYQYTKNTEIDARNHGAYLYRGIMTMFLSDGKAIQLKGSSLVGSPEPLATPVYTFN